MVFKMNRSFTNPPSHSSRCECEKFQQRTVSATGLQSKMSAELVLASGNNASLQGTTLGGSKPLHRFIKGQPKIIGVVVLVLGSSFFIISVAFKQETLLPLWTMIPSGIVTGIMFIISGILYIVTEHNPTKKTVTTSLALSIVTLLITCWTILHITPSLSHNHYDVHYYRAGTAEENFPETEEQWAIHILLMEISIEAIHLFYSIVGAIILIVMSALAGAALRSTKSQAIVVMTTTATETPVE